MFINFVLQNFRISSNHECCPCWTMYYMLTFKSKHLGRNYVSFSSFATDSRLQFCESLPFSNLTQEEESKIQNTYGRKTYFGIFYVILQISIRTKVNTRRHYTFNNFQLWALGPNKTPSSTKGTYRAYHFLR